ncbi:hypothetical protein PTTG_10276 [Puccinia triticina 1-1 BBBD Race 1]|uniref:CCHC-type domain-containing protein n=1 Tax=Puccinia triticina (isolate 1-1 / race 1 (BBBD)) TaxID=630390 RepID=A0A180GVG5_PUCT1|nr:hypothetical protein PTTG_10276 [Puccinia triticina 1-1 BBBD Race 1]
MRTATNSEEENQSAIFELLQQSTEESQSSRISNPDAKAVETTEVPSPESLSGISDHLARTLSVFEDRLEELQALERRLKEMIPVPVLKSAIQTLLICYYCHREGHRFRRCPDLQRDKKGTLVEQKGSSFFLPSGSLIPFNPSRPIRSVVESFQASSPSHRPWYRSYKANGGSLKPWYPTVLSMSSQAPLFPRPRHYHPIRKPPNQSKFQLSVPTSSPRVVGSAKAVDSILKKIANLLVPGLSASKLATASPVDVEHRKKRPQRCSSKPSSCSFAGAHQDRVATSADPVFKVPSSLQSRLEAEILAVPSNLKNLRDEVKLCPSPSPIPTANLASSTQLRQAAEHLMPPPSLRDKVKL